MTLRNGLVSLTAFPAAGGKILDLVHEPSGTGLLWRNPRVPLQEAHAGAAFDDVWSGGWDEIFPTDEACLVDGRHLPDHGDLWLGPWQWDVDEEVDRATLYLRRSSASLPCLMERWITLGREDPSVHVRYRLTNTGRTAVSFLWNIHVAHAIETGSRVHLQAACVGVEQPYAGRAGSDSRCCAWPVHVDAAGEAHDLSRTPGADAGLAEFLWADPLVDGWCAVTHPRKGVGLALAFDARVFTTVWLFADYGGWRGYHVVVTEPSTSRPGSLASNIEAGTARVLEAGTALDTEVVATVLTEIDPDTPAVAEPAGLVRTAAAPR